MRFTGILRTWHDDRGFGFIAPTHGGRELFVHISAFPNGGSRPTEGESLQYELGRGKDGKPQAVRVVRAAIGMQAPKARRPAAEPRGHRRSWVGPLMVMVVLFALGVYAYRHVMDSPHRLALTSASPAEATNSQAPAAPAGARCDGRVHCSQMTSCAEAQWFLAHCPGVEMDGDRDGTPCEQQWCTGPFAR
ncbi:cold shock domain-containing protein [Ideonella sp.]|uniref:cold shock domain-containing protein n=1 Tax=Ideonella sp. TaxID=1929293 RepID=UPI0035B45E62